ncbi:MAG: type II secretion system protein [Candidatus Riflebacteria bacterium]|nr:type II secretion system protein [Candidatus Riflebacteria bacterium]
MFSKGTTLLEILLALFVMAIAVIPIFGLMTKDAKETDIMIAQNFAIDRARSILNTILKDLPFNNILPGNPAIITDGAVAQSLFPCCPAGGGGFFCSGLASDPRGIYFRLYLRSEPILDNSAGYTNGEFFFSVYMNPNVESQLPGWKTVATACIQTEGAGNPSRFEKSGALNPSSCLSPYRYFGAGLQHPLWGPEEEYSTSKQRIYDQRDVHLANPDGRWYLMQRLVLEIRWNLADYEFKNPDDRTGRPQRLQVITYKANLDS